MFILDQNSIYGLLAFIVRMEDGIQKATTIHKEKQQKEWRG